MKSILVVEDSQLLAKIVGRSVRDLGLDVLYAPSMRDAAAILKTHKDDIALSLACLTLPDAPRGEIVDYLIEQNVPVIVFSAEYRDEIRQQMMSKNVVDYIVKRSPYSIKLLRETVRAYLENPKTGVLVVDDSSTNRKYLMQLLTRQNLTVHEAVNGADGLQKIRENRAIKVVITDFHMPVMDGFQLVEAVRHEFVERNIAIIGLSGSGDDRLSAKFIKSGADDFISRPFSEEEFLSRVSKTVDRLRLIEETEEKSASVNAIVSTAVDGIITIDAGGIVEMLNTGAEKIFGYESAEVIGRNVNMLMPEPYKGQHDGYLDAYLKTGQAKVIGIGREVEGRRKDGTSFPMELSVAHMEVLGQDKFTGIVRDISRRKELESRLKKSHEETKAAYETMREDLESASKLQQSRLPDGDISFDGVRFSSFYLPSAYLSGDFFNYFELDCGLSAFCSIDVAGHGVPSALMAVTLSTVVTDPFIRHILEEELSGVSSEQKLPEAVNLILAKLNARFQLDDKTSQYFTLVFGLVDRRSNRLVFGQAGHPNPIVHIPAGAAMATGEGGVPIGFIEDPGYEAQEIEFTAGARFYVFTDGITECENSKGEQLGDDRLIEFLNANGKADLPALGQMLQVHLNEWNGGGEFDDDVSFVAVEAT